MFRTFILLLTILLIGCSGSASPEINLESDPESLEKVQKSLVGMEDKIFTMDNFFDIGWKKSKKLDNESFVNTESIWYGFFNKKDVEIWIYDSHANAIQYGSPYAEKTVNKGAVQFGQTKGTQIRYNSYVILGNSMILCENNLDECKLIVDELK
tara:strand:+ start:150 stop:611 length:462 start_codon:yes stop_codon:yes gene_type:complete